MAKIFKENLLGLTNRRLLAVGISQDDIKGDSDSMIFHVSNQTYSQNRGILRKKLFIRACFEPNVFTEQSHLGEKLFIVITGP